MQLGLCTGCTSRRLRGVCDAAIIATYIALSGLRAAWTQRHDAQRALSSKHQLYPMTFGLVRCITRLGTCNDQSRTAFRSLHDRWALTIMFEKHGTLPLARACTLKVWSLRPFLEISLCALFLWVLAYSVPYLTLWIRRSLLHLQLHYQWSTNVDGSVQVPMSLLAAAVSKYHANAQVMIYASLAISIFLV